VCSHSTIADHLDPSGSILLLQVILDSGGVWSYRFSHEHEQGLNAVWGVRSLMCVKQNLISGQASVAPGVMFYTCDSGDLSLIWNTQIFSIPKGYSTGSIGVPDRASYSSAFPFYTFWFRN